MCAALDEEKVTVVGAGLAGSLMSLLLAKRGLAVRVLEKRSDMRKGSWGRGDASAEKDSDNNDKQDDFQKGLSRFKDSAKRSINLALSHRGICALKEAGIFQKVERLLIPMNGRVIHDIQGNITIQPYGKDHQAIFSVSRQTLNELLLDELDKLENVELMFETGVKRVYPDGSILIEKEGNPVKLFSKFVIGADGAFSGVRKSMMHFCRMDYRQNYLDCGYKELTIPPINVNL